MFLGGADVRGYEAGREVFRGFVSFDSWVGGRGGGSRGVDILICPFIEFSFFF